MNTCEEDIDIEALTFIGCLHVMCFWMFCSVVGLFSKKLLDHHCFVLARHCLLSDSHVPLYFVFLSVLRLLLAVGDLPSG